MIAAIIDLLLISLLIATCMYCMALNRRLSVLRAGQTDLNKAIESFDGAAQIVKTAMTKVEAMGLDDAKAASRAIHDAQSLVNELSVMTTAGSRVADRLEAALDDVRTTAQNGRKAA